MVDISLLPQYVMNGVIIGSVFALAGIGLSLAYGILSLSNFAHGDFVTYGAFMAYLVTVVSFSLLPTLGIAIPVVVGLAILLDAFMRKSLTRSERVAALTYSGLLLGATLAVMAAGVDGATRTTNLMLVAATLFAAGAGAALTVGLEFALWRPLRRKRATVLTLIIVSIGLALVVRNALQMWFGTGNKYFHRPTSPSDVFFGIQVSDAQQFTILAALALILVVHVFLKHTRVGKAMRALSDNRDLALVSGIDVDRIVVYVWIITGALTAVAGVLLTLVANNTMNVNMGFTILLPLFAAVILGGIGSAYGAIVGGFIVGIGMKTSALWLGTKYELAAAFIMLILVMLVRPQGIFGVKA